MSFIAKMNNGLIIPIFDELPMTRTDWVWEVPHMNMLRGIEYYVEDQLLETYRKLRRGKL